jgi:hypothetical protein
MGYLSVVACSKHYYMRPTLHVGLSHVRVRRYQVERLCDFDALLLAYHPLLEILRTLLKVD